MITVALKMQMRSSMNNQQQMSALQRLGPSPGVTDQRVMSGGHLWGCFGRYS
jgi:hypothetical protein